MTNKKYYGIDKYPLIYHVISSIDDGMNILTIKEKTKVTPLYYADVCNMIIRLQHGGYLKKVRIGRTMQVTLTNRGQKLKDLIKGIMLITGGKNNERKKNISKKNRG